MFEVSLVLGAWMLGLDSGASMGSAPISPIILARGVLPSLELMVFSPTLGT
jgi:hypothetical protein